MAINQEHKAMVPDVQRHDTVTLETSNDPSQRRIRIGSRVIALSASDTVHPRVDGQGRGTIIVEFAAQQVQVIPAGKKTTPRRRAPRDRIAEAEKALSRAREQATESEQDDA